MNRLHDFGGNEEDKEFIRLGPGDSAVYAGPGKPTDPVEITIQTTVADLATFAQDREALKFRITQCEQKLTLAFAGMTILGLICASMAVIVVLATAK